MLQKITKKGTADNAETEFLIIRNLLFLLPIFTIMRTFRFSFCSFRSSARTADKPHGLYGSLESLGSLSCNRLSLSVTTDADPLGSTVTVSPLNARDCREPLQATPKHPKTQIERYLMRKLVVIALITLLNKILEGF